MTPVKPIVEEVLRLIGRPYELGAEGPDAFDCWSITRHIQRECFGRELPRIHLDQSKLAMFVKTIAEHQEREHWVKIDAPVHGCIVEMSHHHNPHHIGTWLKIDGGGILHAVKGSGVCFDSLLTLRAAGWRRLVYYDWHG